ncbi:MAG: hypothetical protein R3E58_04090 [Phycisphaerae bacterium]
MRLLWITTLPRVPLVGNSKDHLDFAAHRFAKFLFENSRDLQLARELIEDAIDIRGPRIKYVRLMDNIDMVQDRGHSLTTDREESSFGFPPMLCDESTCVIDWKLIKQLVNKGDAEFEEALFSLCANPVEQNEIVQRQAEQLLWRIDVQREPAKLLAFIASVEHSVSNNRAWAIRRGLELGIDKSKLKAAILEHALGTSDAANRADLFLIRYLAVSGGIMHNDDLPIELYGSTW